MQKGDVVKDMRTLRAMERQGLIIFDRNTGKTVRHWTGLLVKAVYVDSYGPNANGRPFIYNGIEYGLKYFDGCFSPFVIKNSNYEYIYT